jgi:hypothetical protein
MDKTKAGVETGAALGVTAFVDSSSIPTLTSELTSPSLESGAPPPLAVHTGAFTVPVFVAVALKPQGMYPNGTGIEVIPEAVDCQRRYIVAVKSRVTVVKLGDKPKRGASGTE